jgi:hypothetical protein
MRTLQTFRTISTGVHIPTGVQIHTAIKSKDVHVPTTPVIRTFRTSQPSGVKSQDFHVPTTPRVHTGSGDSQRIKQDVDGVKKQFDNVIDPGRHRR